MLALGQLGLVLVILFNGFRVSDLEKRIGRGKK
jgi:acyl-coenzyme A synthetase/AMP-(fatty) acid ligase